VNERIDGSGGRGGEPLSPLRTEAKAALRQAQNLRWLSSSEKLLYWHDLSLESHFAPVAVGGRPHHTRPSHGVPIFRRGIDESVLVLVCVAQTSSASSK
jgi:hypothetical protein